ncbi:MAG TPA: CHASE2 domain-containing protein [Stellaceae bacterium]|nr:CHASE2 domain-containing protein [Stellaceae bacterium]
MAGEPPQRQAAGRAPRWHRARALLRQILVGSVVCLAIAGAYLCGAFDPLDAALLDLQYRLLARDATGSLVIVTIDPKSISALDRWPWPRTDHAALIDRLAAAGARFIALDIDFSSHSTAASDERLAKAIHDADGRVILPVFKERAHDAFSYAAPIEAFQRNARLAAVTVQPASDGRIWRSRAADMWKGWKLPTIAGLMAGRQHDINGSFLIDYGIRPSSVPQISYVDILNGNFDPAAIAGKAVLVGATAVELGDQYAVPLHADLPGVVIQALAYESLVQGTAQRDAATPWILLLGIAVGLPAWLVFRRLSWRLGALAALALCVAIIAASFAVGDAMAIYVAPATAIVGVTIAYLIALVRALDLQRLHILNGQIEAAQRRVLMKTVVESSFDGIIIAEEDGGISMLNPAAVSMLGCDARTVVGTKIITLLPPGCVADAVDPLMIGTAAPWDTTLDSPSGTSRLVEITLSMAEVEPTHHPLERRRKSRNVFIYALHDITERKRAELAQREASTAAIASNRAKTEFLANMSHELRTPLNAVLGFSEMIRDEIFGPIGEKHYAEYAKDIHDAGEHLLDVINDILAMSRIDLGEIQLNEDRVDLLHAIRSAVRLLGLRAQQKNIAIELLVAQELPALWADERAVKQILLNLVSNAVKFTNSGGRVQIAAHLESSGDLSLAISDNGIGIAPDAIARVTQPFYQADTSLERRNEGTGLGLSIVHGLITRHGGSLAIDSEFGVGTTVTLTFPAQRICNRISAQA